LQCYDGGLLAAVLRCVFDRIMVLIATLDKAILRLNIDTRPEQIGMGFSLSSRATTGSKVIIADGC